MTAEVMFTLALLAASSIISLTLGCSRYFLVSAVTAADAQESFKVEPGVASGSARRK